MQREEAPSERGRSVKSVQKLSRGLGREEKWLEGTSQPAGRVIAYLEKERRGGSDRWNRLRDSEVVGSRAQL